MQPTTCLHDGVANAILHEAYLIFDHPIAFHTANGVFNTNAEDAIDDWWLSQVG